MAGDYSKSYVSYERKIIKQKQTRTYILTTLYIVILVAIVIIIFVKFL